MVVGRGVQVEVGAEIEDSLLLDGCRVGRCARVRRAWSEPAPSSAMARRSDTTVRW
jgi:NDP-sugar pyrophosphorylase family protein